MSVVQAPSLRRHRPSTVRGPGRELPHRRSAVTSVQRHSPVERLRTSHLAQVLRTLRDRGPQSRTELCQTLGLSSTTLSKLVAELLEGQWVAESEVRRQHDVGRPQTAITLVPDACRVISVLVEPDAMHVSVAGLDARLGPVRSAVTPFALQDPDRSVQQIASAIQRVVREDRSGSRRPARAVAVALPGLTDSRWRTVLRSNQMGWGRLPLADRLEALTGLPVQIHNNTRAMAFAEFRHLGLGEEEPLLFVQARFGLGAAMVNSARASQLGHFGASELGFIPLGVDAFAGTRVKGKALVDVTNEAYLCRVLDVPTPCPNVLEILEERCQSGDGAARLLHSQTIDNLATGLGIAIDILAPRVIVLGGIYALATEHFADELRSSLVGRAQPELVDELTIRRSELGRGGALQGAALVAFDHLLADGAVLGRA